MKGSTSPLLTPRSIRRLSWAAITPCAASTGHEDKLGIAFVSNAIKRDHQNYLKYGGLGFLLGDGKLNYGRENIVESYYTWHVWRGMYYSIDIQSIDHPGYNRDRGPVWAVGSARGHVDF